MRFPPVVAGLIVLGLIVLALLPMLPEVAAQGVGHGERVRIAGSEWPPVLVADHPFYINVSLENREAARTHVVVFAILYRGAPTSPCDGQRAIDSVSKFEKSVELQPYEKVRIVGTTALWAQQVNGSRVESNGDYEVCVWTRLASCPAGQAIQACFLDFDSHLQKVRLFNRAPLLQVSADPPQGPPGTVFHFTARASDPDQDPVTVAWDFGDGARAEGLDVTHRFQGLGNFTARANATDTWDFSERSLLVRVVEGSGGGRGTPGFEPSFLPAAAALAALSWGSGRAARRR